MIHLTEPDTEEDGRLSFCCLVCRHEVAKLGFGAPVIYGDLCLNCEECGTELVRWREF